MAKLRPSRDEKKLQTRQALMDAALAQVAGGRSYGSLSLREVTREAGVVPASFYRHFKDMDALGLALVDDTFQQLRGLLRSARATQAPGDNMIGASLSTLLLFMNAHRSAFHFLVRERYGGSAPVRESVAREIRGIVIDLSGDFSRFPHFGRLPREDLEMMASLVVNAAIGMVGEILELPPEHPDVNGALADKMAKQLRIIMLGGLAWRPGASLPTAPE